MTALKQNATAPRDIAGSGWAPRRAQEARLRQLEDLLARPRREGEALETEIERAALLGALDRRQDAQQAFIDILRRAPTNFSALNEFGTLLTGMGAIDAACRVYAEAILHHPDNPMGHVNLANLLLRANKHEEARAHYEAALRADPDHAQAHQGLGAVLADNGDRDGAREHFRKGFRGHAISSLPYRGSAPPVALLQLVSSGGGNIPTAPFLDDCIFLTSVVVADYLDPSGVRAAASADLQRDRRCRPLRAGARSRHPFDRAERRTRDQRSPRGDEDRAHQQRRAACRLARRGDPENPVDRA